ncbi:hypothetical protein C4544_01160 [candidate division WS5 bacterium]|uniref:Baseplate protein J-like domain-containing protein n=1 Tax=candidate division WS5 bacterium TaxID=2093353 RepID=A0A419DG46_9BACT|nr:MAG: hypothetical protein C4544_01160 [candidate division WS5 bacterium]
MDNKILYLEIDEEITSVIDRLKKTSETEVHLVVPKEAALLQSIVNLKLLKKQADALGKEIQIITHDKVGRNLAEQVGIHSASKMGEKPEPIVREEPEAEKEIQYKEEPVVEDTKEVVFKKGAVLGDDKKKGTETPADDKGTEKKKVKDLLPKFPRKKFIIISSLAGVLLFAFLYIYVPMTNVKLRVLSEKQDMKTDFLIDKGADNVDSSSGKIPGNLISVEKTVTKEYQATGTKNIGNKAQGTITVKNTYSTLSQTLVAGTRFEANGLVFRTQSDVDVPGYSDSGGGDITAGTANVSVIADSAGDNYNISSSSFKIPAFAGTAKYDKITGSSAGSMSGGSTKEVKVVSASDISNARNSFGDNAKNEVKKEGQGKMDKDETIDEKAEEINVGALNVSKSEGDEADKFTVSANASYKALAYKKDDLSKMVYDSLKEKTGPGKQIMEDKLETVELNITDVNLNAGTISGEASAVLHLGAKIDEGKLKTEISGDKEAKTKEYLENLDGVESVQIDYFPGFFKRTSRLKSHIYVKIEFAEK